MLMLTPEGVVFKQDWTPERVGRAHWERPVTTQADEFAQRVLVPPTIPDLKPARAVELSDSFNRLVAFLNR
jgi:hypothetical protein